MTTIFDRDWDMVPGLLSTPEDRTVDLFTGTLILWDPGKVLIEYQIRNADEQIVRTVFPVATVTGETIYFSVSLGPLGGGQFSHCNGIVTFEIPTQTRVQGFRKIKPNGHLRDHRDPVDISVMGSALTIEDPEDWMATRPPT